MTPRERFVNSLTFEPVDRVFNQELGLWGHTYERWYEEGMPRDVLYGDWFSGEEYFGLDQREFIPLNMGMMPGFDHEVLEEDERTVVFRGGDGVVHKALKEGTVGGTRASMDQYLRFPVENAADLADMKARHDPDVPTRYPSWWPSRVRAWSVREHALTLGTNGCVGLYSRMRQWMGTENLSLAFYDQPALVEEMLEFIVDFCKRLWHQALQTTEIDHFNYFEDFAFKTGPLFSPDLFRRLFKPRYLELNEFLNAHGVKIITLDSDGNTEVLIGELMDCGITGHWPFERAAEMDPVRIRKDFPTLSILGGVDKRELTKDKEAIRRHLRELAPLIEQGGFIPTLDHTFPPDISYDNFLYYMELKGKLLAGEGF
jgi:uroporphyrinogen decarboxylase